MTPYPLDHSTGYSSRDGHKIFTCQQRQILMEKPQEPQPQPDTYTAEANAMNAHTDPQKIEHKPMILCFLHQWHSGVTPHTHRYNVPQPT